MKRLSRILNESNIDTVLDVATGSGQFIEQIMSVYNGFIQIDGIDTNTKAIEIAERRIEDSRVIFKNESIFDLKSKKYDLITLSNSLHHFENLDFLFGYLTDHLNDKGMILIQEMYANHLTEAQETHKMFHHFWAEIDMLTGVVHNPTFEKERIVEICKHFKNLNFEEAWTIEHEENYSLSNEDRKLLQQSLEKSLKRIKDEPVYEKYVLKSTELNNRLETFGFETASQIIVMLRKS